MTDLCPIGPIQTSDLDPRRAERGGAAPAVTHGFVIVKPNGSAWDDYLYPGRDAAERVAKCFGLDVRPARKVSSFKPVNSMLLTRRTDLIIEQAAGV